MATTCKHPSNLWNLQPQPHSLYSFFKIQLDKVLLAALSVTTSAVPRASPVPSGSIQVGAKRVPRGYDDLFSLIKDTRKKLSCYLRIAGNVCSANSGKTSNYNAIKRDRRLLPRYVTEATALGNNNRI